MCDMISMYTYIYIYMCVCLCVYPISIGSFASAFHFDVSVEISPISKGVSTKGKIRRGWAIFYYIVI